MKRPTRSTARPCHSHRSLQFEALEDRQLMAGDVYVNHAAYETDALAAVAEERAFLGLGPGGTMAAGGTESSAKVVTKNGRRVLEIHGSKYNDTISVRESGSDLIVTLVRHIGGKAQSSGPLKFKISELQGIVCYGHDGNDEFAYYYPPSAVSTLPVWAAGGAGDDTLYGGKNVDFLDGGAGVDALYGKEEADILAGGNEPDVKKTSKRDYLSGGAGDDQLVGEDGPDVLWGDAGADVLVGGRGNDLLEAGRGQDNDHLFGGAGDDTLKAWEGNDFLDGGDDNDQLNAHNGDDTLRGGNGNDSLYGENDNDNLYGGPGDDKLYGGSGNDGLYGGTGVDQLFGGAGNDRFLVIAEPGERNDVATDEGVIYFRDGAGHWADGEIERIDLGLRELHLLTGNSKLLRTASGNWVTLVRGATSAVDPLYHAVNFGNGTIEFYNAAFSGPAGGVASVAVHEIAHNWDAESAGWPNWLKFNGWSPTKATPAHLLSGDGKWYYDPTKATWGRDPYGRENPYEDWATSWQSYFYHHKKLLPNDADGTNPLSDAKRKYLDDFFASLR